MSENIANQLPIPRDVEGDSAAFELVRIWVAGGGQRASIATGIWDDPAAWGMMLVDLARHIANAYEQTEGLDADDVLSRIKQGFDAEWESPTDVPSGDLQE